MRRYITAHPDLAERFAKFDLFKPQIIRVILNPVKLTFSEHDGGSRMCRTTSAISITPFLVSRVSAMKTYDFIGIGIGRLTSASLPLQGLDGFSSLFLERKPHFSGTRG